MKRFLIAAGGAALLVAGALGVTYAQSAPTAPVESNAKQQRQAILSDAAAQLGVSADQLQQALKQARKSLGAHPLAKIRKEELQVAAQSLGLTDGKALRKELAGSTLTAVAQKHGVQPSTVASAITADLDARIQSLASAGTISANRATALQQKVSTRVAALMTHQFPAAKRNSG